ncbi:LysR family transcriptional regulator [Atopomonas sediminilitoris]|uniref:LysR family transcriptional regulator n=1 Tax=Atopomonas sediminilitoris TaxID=2919919 RepID=UPI001F4E8809|nr:LysR family transcriptional regulator [Atopomonas sediminilitoris]MCJ8168801.1 LysR family transcriptional regulator [Atopomonas sediminilitoris]
MDLANLNAFIAIAETGSFSAAAERLFLTQPAVSKRLANLEQQLAVRLFDRLGRDISLTEAGRALLPRAYRILAELADSRRALANLSGTISGRLSLATSHHIGLHRLPPVLRQFTREHPEVALDIRFVDSEVAYTDVLQGQVELGVITLAPQPRDNIHSERIWHDPLAFFAGLDHPLTRISNPTLKDVAEHPAVFPAGNTFTHQITRELFQRYGLQPHIAMSTNYLETIKMLVSIGLAWSVLPSSLLDDQVCALAVRNTQLARELGFICHRERTLSNAAKAFIECLQQHGNGLPDSTHSD